MGALIKNGTVVSSRSDISEKITAAGKKIKVEMSSGNIFADLGLPHAEERLLKLRLTVAIIAIVKRRRLSRILAAKKLCVTQTKVSALLNYKLENFSVERLMHFVTALEHDVVIEIRPRGSVKRLGRVTVVDAT